LAKKTACTALFVKNSDVGFHPFIRSSIHPFTNQYRHSFQILPSFLLNFCIALSALSALSAFFAPQSANSAKSAMRFFYTFKFLFMGHFL